MCSQSASAESYYFSKPGVSRAAYVADVSECSELTGGSSYRSGPAYVHYQNTTAGAIGASLGLILVSIMAGQEQKRMRRAVERTCMADKGYLRRQVDHSFISDIRQIKNEDARVSRFFDYASAANPVGKAIGE